MLSYTQHQNLITCKNSNTEIRDTMVFSTQQGNSLTLSRSSSPSSFSESSMAEPFCHSTKTMIRSVCQDRCMICLRRVGNSGECAHILDSSNVGRKMVTFGIGIGILEPNFSRSTVENGLFLCPSCHQNLFSHPDVFLSLPQQVLQYLIKIVEGMSERFIHEILKSLALIAHHPYPDIPDPRTVLPFLGLYTLVTLDPSELESMDFHIHVESEVSQLSDESHAWTLANAHVTSRSSSSVTARIYDPTILSPTNHNAGCDLQVSTISEQRYWRLPNKITPILTRLLYSVSCLNGSDTSTEELRLAIKLRSLLALRSLGSELSNSDPDIGGSGSRKRGRNM